MSSTCPRCFEATLNRVSLPWWRKQHIIERHYPSEEICEERSFFDSSIPHNVIFDGVVNAIRCGLQPSWNEGHRYIYFHTFDRIVGCFPNRQGVFCKTDTVKIVCSYTECHQCHRHWPQEIVTIYPFRNPSHHP